MCLRTGKCPVALFDAYGHGSDQQTTVTSFVTGTARGNDFILLV